MILNIWTITHSFDNLVHAFKQFILNLPFYGFAIACIDHDMVRNMIKDITTRHITYGIDHESAHVRAFNIKLGHFHSEYHVIINLPQAFIYLIRNNTIEIEISIYTSIRWEIFIMY